METSTEALKREFLEEINTEIVVKDFLGISENISTFEGKNAHELVLYYNVDILDKDYKDEYVVTEDNGKSKAFWVDIDDFKCNDKILYPTDVFRFI